MATQIKNEMEKKLMKKILTYAEFMALAQENYCKGGDCVVECWDEVEFNDYVKEFGPITKEKAYSIFRLYASRR